MDMNKYVEKVYVDKEMVNSLVNREFVILSYIKDKTNATFGAQPIFLVELLGDHKKKEWTMGWNDVNKWIAKHGPESTNWSGMKGIFSVGKSKKNVDILVGEPL
jgi:hypothetical protein